MIMASAVIVTGRIRVKPADRAASMAFFPSTRSSLAKVTSRMLFAVATPMHISAPISAGTLNVVRVRYSIHNNPAIAPGSAIRIMNGSSHDWKLTAIKR